MKTIAELAKCRQDQRMNRGPWPNEEAKKFASRELAEELADCHAFAEQLQDPTVYPNAKKHIMALLGHIFDLLDELYPEGVEQAFDATREQEKWSDRPGCYGNYLPDNDTCTECCIFNDLCEQSIKK